VSEDVALVGDQVRDFADQDRLVFPFTWDLQTRRPRAGGKSDFVRSLFLQQGHFLSLQPQAFSFKR
jgi:hypothetical protein